MPIMNLFPDQFGPHADGTPASSEGAATIHTPRDNLQTLNLLTSADQTGNTASDGWMTGMELCAHLEARYMLQPEMGGAQTANLDPVAFMDDQEARGAVKGKLVTFDAAGSYQYTSLVTKGYVADADLQYKWDFGDGSPAAFGKVVKHAYKKVSEGDVPYKATLTVTNRDTHAADTVTRNVLVDGGRGQRHRPRPERRPRPAGEELRHRLPEQRAVQVAVGQAVRQGPGLHGRRPVGRRGQGDRLPLGQGPQGDQGQEGRRVHLQGLLQVERQGRRGQGHLLRAGVRARQLLTAGRPELRLHQGEALQGPQAVPADGQLRSC